MRWTSAVLLLLGIRAANAAQLQADARLLWEFTAPHMTPVDLNRDSSDELLVYDADNYIVGRDQLLQVSSASRRFPDDTRRAGPPVAVSDSQMWAPRVRGDSLYMWPLWRGREFLVCPLPHPARHDYWDGSLAQGEVEDINSDGRAELILTTQAGFSQEPRGVYVCDAATGRRLWSRPIGPNPDSLLLHDINGDSNLELILGSVAPGNGNVVAGSDDSRTYVFCLLCDGTILWQKEIGRFGQTASVSWLAGRVLVHENGCPVDGAEPDSIFILDPLNGSVLSAAQLGRYGRGVVLLPGDSLFVTVATDDTLRCIDASLRTVRGQSLGTQGAVCIGRGSFTAAGRVELAVATTDGGLLLYDSDLRLLARTQPGRVSGMWTLRHAERQRLLTVAVQGGRNVWRLYEFNSRVPLLTRRVTLGSVLAGIGCLLVLFAVALVGIRFRQTRDIRAVVRGLTGQSGVVEMNRRGTVRKLNPKARELLVGDSLPDGPLVQAVRSALADPRGAQPRELPVVLDNGKTVLARAVRVRSGVMLTLEDISAVEYLRRVQTWVPVAQKLAHGIKNPLTAIGLTLQRVEKQAGPDSHRYVESMKEDIDRLRRMTDSFMRFTRMEPPKLEPGDINALVRECAGKFDSAGPPGIELKLELADDLPRVLFDPKQMSEACTNVIENAISAVGSSGVLTVRTSLAASGRLIAVSVSDTGHGIPERYLAKVFDPYFTLKPGGTGLGMAVTKRIVEDHKGTIRIESKEGVGTTVIVELPMAGTTGA
jgi:signal transduction histidine kinase/outer membrane protein assembly factor BamB